MEQTNIPIIQIKDVSKQYRLGVIGGTTLRAEIQRAQAKILHKEDPTLKIGAKQVDSNESFWALKDVSIDINKGEALGIIGHNGAGKSTLLKLLCRVTAPTEGTISYDGRIASMLEVGTGFHPELTGRENIYLNGAILGMNREEIDRKIEDIIEFSECRQFIDTPVKRYSSGMYVKLAFSVAAHLDSEIMIMDEVLAVGDMAFQKKCLDKMRENINKEGRTILYVSHNMNTIRQLCDRCIVLSHGRVVFQGDVDDAIELYLGIEGNSPQSIDLVNKKRTNNTSDGVKLTNIRVLERDQWHIKVGEKLRFSISVAAIKDLNDIGFRARVSSVDNVSVSVLLAPSLFSCKKGDNFTIPLEADVSQLVPGRYCLTPVLYGVNEYGGWQFYDHIEQAVNFEVESIPGFNQNMEWQTRFWGYIKLPFLSDLRTEK